MAACSNACQEGIVLRWITEATAEFRLEARAGTLRQDAVMHPRARRRGRSLAAVLGVMVALAMVLVSESLR